MSEVRVHNFSISLDGFGTGDGIVFDAPFGHAGERLHEWMFATRFWRSMVGDGGGTWGADHSFANRHGLGIGAEIMGRGLAACQRGRGPKSAPTLIGTVGGPTRRSTPAVRAHAPPAPADRDGGRHRVPLSRRQPAGGARPRPGGRLATSTCASGGGPTVVRDFLAAEASTRSPRRPGADPARPRRSPVGRPRGRRGALRHRGGLGAERCHPPHLHTAMTDQRSDLWRHRRPDRRRSRRRS